MCPERWLPGGTRVMLWALSVLPAPDVTESQGGLPAAPFGAASGKPDTVHDSKGKEGISLNCSFSNNGLFCWWVIFFTQ